MTKYLKFIGAIITGAIGWATMVVNSAPASITATEWIAGATFIAASLVVFGVPNTPAP